MKEFYWADGLADYRSNDNEEFIEIKRLNFYIGKNNAGKSRFLRTFFVSNKTYQDYNTIDKIETLEQTIQELSRLNNIRNINDLNKELLTLAEKLDNNSTPPYVKAPIISKIYNEVNKSNYNHIKADAAKKFWDEFQTMYNMIKMNSLFNKKSYIPVLRGLRPLEITSTDKPYTSRTCKDYNPEKTNPFNSENVITGEKIYNDITTHLLGEPEHRQLIKSYEEKLSQYFFDNQPITLIPKHDSDVVHIKIGDDKQFPIHQLGDGLQQVVILTFEAFLKNDEVHAFFIEEPELHMHPGMLRQLMNFYLNETKYYYFFTTHSNHLLDMADETDQVIIQKFVKEPNKENPNTFDFKIYRCDRDRELLATLGVKPSSVYLANCTIWVEGITDRLYISKYMAKYLENLKSDDLEKYKKYLRFMPNYHYAFVEYAGSNIAHWSFDDEFVDTLEDKGMSAKAITSDMILIADGDNKSKIDRVETWISELESENLHILEVKETENSLPFDAIISVAKSRFSRMKPETIDGFDIAGLDHIQEINYFEHTKYGIGKLLDSKIRLRLTEKKKTVFADGTGVGTIKDKTKFCRAIIKYMDENPNWQLTPEAKRLCEKIYQHIEKRNS